MTTRAGRLSRISSQGSPTRSAARIRPIAMPSAVPNAMASANARTTRARVTARLRKSAPERASVTITCATASGPGSICGPAKAEPISQAAKKATSDRRRSIGRSFPRPVERAGRELGRGTDQRGTADARQHSVERSRVGFLVGDRTAGNSGTIALAQNFQRRGLRDAGERRDLPPRVVGGRELVLRLARHRDETIDRITVLRRPTLVEHVAEHRGYARGAEPRQHVLDAGDAAQPFRLQLGAQVPVVERRVELAAQRLGGEQRRRAVRDGGLLLELDAVLRERGLQQEPALVERSARDRERAPLEVGKRVDGRRRRRHDGAERARVRIEHEPAAERALARYPEPVGHDHVDRAAAQRDSAGFRRGEVAYADVEAGLPVEVLGTNDRELPGKRAGLLRRDTNGIGRHRGRGDERQRRDSAGAGPRPLLDMITNAGHTRSIRKRCLHRGKIALLSQLSRWRRRIATVAAFMTSQYAARRSEPDGCAVIGSAP